MKLRRIPVSRLSLPFAAALASLLATQATQALDFAWDPGNTQTGGAGSWINTGSPLNWDSGTQTPSATADVAWVDGAGNNAYFTGSGDVVTLGTSINAGTLNFSTTGYQITLGGNALTLNAANTGIAATLNLNGAGVLTLKNDGTGTGALQSVNFLENLVVSNSDTINVGKLGSTGNAANKTLRLGNLSIGAQTLTVTPSNGFGLEFTGTTTLTAAATFNVSTAAASDVVQGLTLTGQLTGGFGIVKTGAGTLVLGNNATGGGANSFGSGGSLIDIQGGVLQVASNEALGDSANIVQLSSATQALRVAGTFATAHTIKLNLSGSGIDVTGGNTLTVNAAFTTSSTANTFTKADNGVLALASGVDNSGLTGLWTVNAGAIEIFAANNLNASASALTVSNAVGSALQLTNGVTLNKSGTLTLNGSGLNSAGSLQSVGTFTNTVSSLITLGSAATLGADSGSTLILSGGITAGAALPLTFNTAGSGAIKLTGTAISANVTPITKIGSGTLTFDVDSSLVVAPINVNAGTLDVKTGVLGGTGLLTVEPGASLNLTGTTANRLGGRPLTLSGTLNMSGAATETTGLLTLNPGQSIINNTSGSTLTLGAAAPTRNTGATALFKGGSTTNFGALPTFVGVTTAGGTSTTQGILPWAIFDAGNGTGSSFVTTNATTPFTARALVAGEMSAANAFTAGSNVLLGGVSTAITTSTAINSLTSNTTSGVTINSPTLAAPAVVTLTVSSGGILSTAATDSISGGVLALGNGIVFTPGATAAADVVTISSAVTGATLTKAGAGTLVLASASGAYAGYSANAFTGGSHSGGFFINEGVVQLGANNALYCGNFNDANSLTVNAGGSLDLNGKTQFVGALYGQPFVAAGMTAQGVAGGTVTSSGGSGNLILVGGNPGSNGPFAFAGSITGANVGFASKMAYSTSAGWAQMLLGANSYGGSTLIYGGGTYLKDDGTMSGTSDVSLDYGILYLDNTGLSNNNDRLKNSASISMSGGTLSYLGRAQTASTETVGAINLVQGVSTIAVTTGGTGVNSADLTVDSIGRTAGSGATVAFSLSGTAGSIGSGNGRVNVNSPASFTAAMVNGIIPWTAVGGNLGSYIPYTTANGVSSGGVGALGTAGYAAYDSTATTYTNVNQPTWNAYAGGGATITGSTTLNSLGVNGTTLNFTNPSDTLNVVSGGLLVNGNVNTIGATLDSGRITAGGAAASGTVDLYLWSGSNNNNSDTLNSRIVDNGSGARTRLVLTFRGDGNRALTMNDGSNSYTGGTVMNTSATLNAASGVVIPNDLTGLTGLVINGTSTVTTVTMNNSAGQIGAGNLVTLNGGSILTLFQNNTLAGLVLNNTGGASPTVNTGGVLTLNSGITTTSNNIGGTATLNGRVSLPSGATLSVGAATFNGQIINPLFADLIVTGLAGGGGTTTKSGAGVLQFNVPTVLTGTLDVTVGGIQAGAANAGSRLADVVLENGTWLNLNGQSPLFGSLATPAASTGMVTNSGALATLTVGFDGANTSFAGAFTRYNDATVNLINLTKIGGGTMTLTGNSSTASGTLTVSGGGITFKDSGINNFLSGTTVVNQGGILTLDNSGTTNVNNRFTPAGTNLGLTLNGGAFAYIGRASTASIDANGTSALTFGSGESTLTANEGASGGTSLLTFGSLSSGAGSSYTFAGTDLGTASDKVMLTGVTNGTVLFRGAVGNDFAVYDTTLGVKAYTGYSTNANINSAGGSNFKLDATTTTRNLTGTLSLATLDFADNNATLGSNGSLLPTQGLTLSNAAVLVNGSNDVISTPVLALSAEGIFRVNGSNTLTISGAITGGQALTKTGSGTLLLSAREPSTGTITVNQGTLKLNSGSADTLAVVPTASTPTMIALTVNGGSFDIGGQNQAVGSLSSTNPNVGAGGSVINSGSLATFTSGAAGNTTFAGQIGGGTDGSPTNNGLNFVKAGANTLTLTSPNTYSGATTLRGGGLTLKDSGTLLSTSTSAINVVSGTLMVDQTGLNPVGNLNPTRISAAAPVTLSGGGGIYLNGGASVDSSMTLNSVTTASGTNLINVNSPNPNTAGGTSTINIGSLVQGSLQAAVRFNTPKNAFGLGQPGVGAIKINITNTTPMGGGSVPTESLLVNGLLPGWMNVISNVDNGGNIGYSLAGYLPTSVNGSQGVGALGSANYPGVSGGAISSAGAADNLSLYNVTSMALTPVTTRTVNSINYSRTAGWSMASATDTLTIGTGTFLNIYSGQVGSMDLNGGKLTSGTGALYMNVYDGAMVVNSSIVDNAGAVALVKQGTASMTLDPRVNIYNGSTTLYLASATTINLSATSTVSPLFVGQTVTGSGIQANTTITNIAGTTITLSLPTTGPSAAGNLIFTAPTATTNADGSSVVTTATSAFVPTLGMTVTGAGTTPGTRITNVAGGPGAYTLTLSNSVPAGTPTLSYGAQSNSYTGGTYVNEGVLTFAALSTQMLPGDVTINGSAVATALTETAAGQLAATANVTINGGGTLTMSGTNTLNSLTFDNIGTTATVAGATSLTLSAANAITATNDNLSVTPSITGTALVLSNAAPVINVAGASPDGLIISAPITSAGGVISKTGSGSLVLPVANSFTTGFNLNDGALIVDNNTALGSGTLAIADGTALMSGTGVRTLNNQVTVAGSFIFGALTPAYGTAVANNGVTLSNTVTFAAGAHQITVDGLANLSTISGQLTGGTNLTKAGPGTLVLNNATNNFGGSVSINGGTLQQNVAGSVPSGQIMNVAAGAAFNMNGITQSVDSLNGAGSVINPGGAVALTVNGSANGSFSGVLAATTAANLSLIKNGPNTQTLSGTNPYGGTTTVTAGTLLINGANTGTGAVSVGASGTLGGTGSIAGAVNVTGVLSPGASIGTLTSGALTFANNSTYQYQVNSSVSPSVGADLQIVNGALNLNTPVTLNLTDIGAGSISGGTVFSLFNYSGAWNSGTFTYLSNPLAEDSTFTFAGKTWTIDYDATTKGANVAGAQSGSYVNITAAGADAYTTWIQTPAFAIPGGLQGPNDDPDGDGATNLEEFAFGGIPNDPTKTGLVFGLQADSNDPGTAKEMILTIAVRSGVTFSTPGSPAQSDAMVDGLLYSIQGSTDLNHWTAVVTPVPVINPGLPALPTGYQYVSFSLNGSDGLPGKGFLRAKVTKP